MSELAQESAAAALPESEAPSMAWSHLELILVGSLLTIGVYHLGVFWLWRQDRAPLFFGLFCLSAGMRFSLTGELALYSFLPDLSWRTAVRLDNLSLFAGLPMAVLFIRSLYPMETTRRIAVWVLWISGAFAAAALVVPFASIRYLLPPFQMMIVAVVAYMLYALVLAVHRGRDGAAIALIGGCALSNTAVYDVLYTSGLLPQSRFAYAGLLVFVMSTSLIISLRTAKAFRQVEIISSQMQELNAGLELKIKERTAELERSNQSLVKMNESLERSEQSRRRLLSNISHELGTPITLIQGYAEALMDGVMEPDQRHRYLRLIHARVAGLNRLMQDLFQLSRLEARQISFDMRPLPVDEYVRHFYERYELEVKEAGLRFVLDAAFEEKAPGSVVVDLDRMDQVFTNIIYNAIKHTPAGGTLRFVCEAEAEPPRLVTKICDNGKGIGEDDLPFLFDRFYQISPKSAEGGSGLGLPIAKEIIEYHGGSIWVESREGQGTSVCFMLPVHANCAEARIKV